MYTFLKSYPKSQHNDTHLYDNVTLTHTCAVRSGGQPTATSSFDSLPFPHHSNGLVYSTLDGTNGVKLRADKRANLPLKHLSGYNIKWFGQH